MWIIFSDILFIFLWFFMGIMDRKSKKILDSNRQIKLNKNMLKKKMFKKYRECCLSLSDHF
jgi:hypothetical protein